MLKVLSYIIQQASIAFNSRSYESKKLSLYFKFRFYFKDKISLINCNLEVSFVLNSNKRDNPNLDIINKKIQKQ